MNCLASRDTRFMQESYIPNILRTMPVTPIIEFSNKINVISTVAGIIRAQFACGFTGISENPLIQGKPAAVHLRNIKGINNENLVNNTTITVIENGSSSYNILTSIKAHSENTLVGGKSMEELMKKNVAKLKEFGNLDLDWNGYGAEPFSRKLLESVDNIIRNIIVQPEVFPTGRKSVQFEYEKDSGEYLELEVFIDRIEVFSIDKNGLEKEFNIQVDNNEVNKVVTAFNG